MRACSTAGGAVMFIPDEIKRKAVKRSYRQLIEDEVKVLLEKPFGKKKSDDKTLRDAA